MERWEAEGEWKEIRQQLDGLYQKQKKLLAEEEATTERINLCRMKKSYLAVTYGFQDESPKMNIALSNSTG